MSVSIPPVRTFPNVEPSKAQAVKVLEEAAEVFAAWQDYDRTKSWGDDWDMCVANNEAVESIVEECCDVIVATCNLLAAMGVDDLTYAMERCEKRNEERGRYGAE